MALPFPSPHLHPSTTLNPRSSFSLHPSSPPYQPPHFKTSAGSPRFSLAAPRKQVSKRFGRREIFLDGVSSMCSTEVVGHNVNGPGNEYSKDFSKMASRDLFFQTRRVFAVTLSHLSSLPWCLSALALENPSVTIEELTPPVIPSGPLFPFEERIATLFEDNTYSVVNIFDSTLRPQLNSTGSVEVPQGNGSGVVWDRLGHIVTNYHVVGNALSRNPSFGDVVARVNILASESLEKTFEGKLVGADRSKDLAVLKVDYA